MTGTSQQGGTEVIPHTLGLRPRTNSKEIEHVADAALISAEEKMLEDEEVASIDGFGNPVADTVKIENRNLEVAFARSVADDDGDKADYQQQKQPQDDSSTRYVAATTTDGSASAIVVGTGDDATRRKPGEPQDQQLIKVEPGESVPLSTPAPQPVASPPLLKAVPFVTPATNHPPVVPPQRPPRLPIVISNPSVVPKRVVVAAAPSSRPPVHTSSHGVPNPLANLATPVKQEPPAPIVRPAPVPAPPKPVARPAYQSAVPCPLPAVLQPPKHVKMHAPTPLPAPVMSIPVATPMATVSMDLLPTKRGRIFSMDIDPAGLDFPDMSVDNIGSNFCPSPALPPLSSMASKQPQHSHSSMLGNHGTPSCPPPMQLSHSGARSNAPVPLQAPSSEAAALAMGRDRAMSFEFFSLGINADEPLPPAPDMALSTYGTGRPRGDSIIFDPVSFQDGGIHEEKAFFRSRTNSIDLPSKDEMAIMNTPGFVAPTVSATAVHKPMVPASFRPQATTTVQQKNPPNAAQMATLPSSLNTTMNHATFQMDLLNKDGRIGIYLPDARKARIAKFHSKRKMRIWRKRIKYDCRKKLADSRPRIKGRFVKRSDMDDDH